MGILIKQELYKLFKRKKTLVVIIAFIILTAFLSYGIKQSANFMEEYSTEEAQIENLEWNLSYLESDLENIPSEIQENEEEIEFYQENIRREIEMVREEINRLEENMTSDLSWEDALAEDIEYYEEIIATSGHSMDSDELARMNMQLDELKYLENQNIEPQQQYSFNGFIQIRELVGQIGQMFLVIGISVFAADMISGEWTPPTMKLLLTQPVSRFKVLLSKFIAVMVAALGLILIIELISFIIIGFSSGFGDLNYPAVINRAYEFDNSIILEDGTHPLALIDGSWDIVPVWQYTIMTFVYQALFIISTVSFVLMISSIAKSSMISMGVSVVSLIAASIIFQVSSFYGLGKYVFTTYSSIGDLISGDLSLYISDPNITSITAIIVMIHGQ